MANYFRMAVGICLCTTLTWGCRKSESRLSIGEAEMAAESGDRPSYEPDLPVFDYPEKDRPRFRRMSSLEGVGLKRADIRILKEIKRIYPKEIHSIYGESLFTNGRDRYGLFEFDRVENMAVQPKDTIYGFIAYTPGFGMSYMFWNRTDSVTQYKLKVSGFNVKGKRYLRTLDPFELDVVRMLSDNTIEQELPQQHWKQYFEDYHSTLCFVTRLYIRNGVITRGDILRLYDPALDLYQTK